MLLTSLERLIRTLSRVPWPRAGCISAAALLLSRYDPDSTWEELMKLYCSMAMLVALPLLAEALHLRVRTNFRPNASPTP